MSFILWTANLQHGTGTDGVFNISRQTTALAGADIVCAQEVSTSDLASYDSNFATNGLSRAVFQQHPGTTDGNAIWYKPTTITLEQTFTYQLENGINPTSGSSQFGRDGTTDIRRNIAAIKARHQGKTFYLTNVHLVHSAGNDAVGSLFSVQRVTQIQDLLRWIEGTFTSGIDVVIVGDMNFGSDTPMSPSGFQQDLFHVNYNDLWTVGLGEGTAVADWGDRDENATPDMPLSDETDTHDNRRIDRCYLRKSNRTLSLSAVEVPDQRATCSVALTGSPLFCPDVEAAQRWGNTLDFGVRPSDHNFVKVTMGLNPSAPTIVRRTNFSWFPNVRI